MDIYTPEKRSEVMAAVRGSGNLSTEMRMVALFRQHGVKGWRRHQSLPGRPDFVFRDGKVAVFVDGCFWHGCPTCYRAPASNREFWQNKVLENRRRDRRVSRELRRMGWSVIRVRECVLKKRTEQVVARIRRKIESRRESREGD